MGRVINYTYYVAVQLYGTIWKLKVYYNYVKKTNKIVSQINHPATYLTQRCPIHLPHSYKLLLYLYNESFTKINLVSSCSILTSFHDIQATSPASRVSVKLGRRRNQRVRRRLQSHLNCSGRKRRAPRRQK